LRILKIQQRNIKAQWIIRRTAGCLSFPWW